MKSFNLSCPIPKTEYPRVILSHGGGGKLMHQLIEKMFVSVFSNPYLEQRHDSSILDIDLKKIAFTTDSYVVQPLFFPGGNIGSMAVHGTVNDLAMSGATPKYLSAGFIIEEGFEMEDLWEIVLSMKQAADEAGVYIVTGDTKVVDKGKGDGIFINTAGIGVIEHDILISPKSVRKGDAIIINGDIGRHGIAIMAKREGLSFESKLESDSQEVSSLVQKLLKAGIKIHCLRDLTRGGLASTLNEIASASGYSIGIEEDKIPVREDVRGACEILGFDPLYVACEGRFIAFVPEEETEKALKIFDDNISEKPARVIGAVKEANGTPVTIKTKIGVDRIIDMITGEQLPRIC